MAFKVLEGTRILAVDDEWDVLEILEEELVDCGVIFDRCSTYDQALQRLSSFSYDVVIFDIMGVRGFDLLEYAVAKKIAVVMLTAHALNVQSLKKSIDMGARAYLPKDQLGQIAPFIADVLTLNHRSAWMALFAKLGSSFGRRFGPEWRRSEKEFWERLNSNQELTKSTIIEP